MSEPTPEEVRMEIFYESRLPLFILNEGPFDRNLTTGEYANNFGQLAWSAWQAAQNGTADCPKPVEGAKPKAARRGGSSSSRSLSPWHAHRGSFRNKDKL